VVKCNYNVSDTRVGNEMDYDKLTLELETDGSIKASDAVATAATILMNCFELFRPLATGPIPEARDGSDMTRQSSDQQAEEEKIDLSGIPIEELELSVRAFNCLKRAEINTLDQLAEKTEEELGRVRNLGKKSIDEIIEKLAQFRGLGLHLKD
jgi:DNA-directed RNA polymerase subunit alpha (EC 2.7.7.6)